MVENTVLTAIRPIQIFQKIIGFSPLSNDRTNPKYTFLSTIHVVVLLLLQFYLIYYNLYPSKFDVTNSNILNYGLWIQTEASLFISVVYILLGIKKISCKRRILEKFKKIDDEFQKEFYVEYYYIQVQRWVAFTIVAGLIVHFILSDITAYYIWNLPFEVWHRWSICIAIFLSNICIYCISNQFACGVLYLSSRFTNINGILSQLIFDQPISSYLRLVDNEPIGVVSESLKSTTSGPQKQNVKRDDFERSGKSNISIIDTTAGGAAYSFQSGFPKHISDTTHIPRCKRVRPASILVVLNKTCVSKLVFTKSTNLPDVLKKLDKLMELHDRLCDCVEECNYLLALEALLISLTIFVYVVFGLFAKYRVWMDYQYEAANVAQMNIYWIVIYSACILSGTHVSSRLMESIRETPVIIHKIACRNGNIILLNKLSQISQMLYSRKTFVGCGLIMYDWATVFSMFGSVCMYLIILIQFYFNGKSTKIDSESNENCTEIY